MEWPLWHRDHAIRIIMYGMSACDMLMTPHAIKHTVLLHIDANGVAWHGCSLQCVFVMVCGEGEGAGGEWPGCALALCYFT